MSKIDRYNTNDNLILDYSSNIDLEEDFKIFIDDLKCDFKGKKNK